MAHRVVPFMTNPLILSDFLTDAYAVGGVTSVLALNSLFKLITEHNLDYPDFFEKLYELLDLNSFTAKHRSQFFELLDRVLSSSHLATYLVAAFAKKMARLALFSPPGTAMFAIVLISNLLKKHPTCLHLVHHATKIEEAAEKGELDESKDINVEKRSKLDAIKEASLRLALGPAAAKEAAAADEEPAAGAGRKRRRDEVTADPFKMDEANPAKCRASESCLWEIEALASHYSPNVSMLVQSLFYTELRVTVETRKVEPPVPIEEFLDLTYKSLFDRDIKRARRSKKVALTFHNRYSTAAPSPAAAAAAAQVLGAAAVEPSASVFSLW